MKTFSRWVEEQENKKKIFVLVGPPSVGKSTWIANTFKDEPYVINRDDIVNQIAKGMRMTYDEMFMSPPSNAKIGDLDPKYGKVVASPSFMTWQPLSYENIKNANDTINHLLKEKFANAVGSGLDIVVDMTNMTARARQSALEAVKGHEAEYHKVAVVFPFRGAEHIIKKVSAMRAEKEKQMGGSKTIPETAFDRMFSSFQEVSSNEGFDEIIQYDNRELLSKLAQGLDKQDVV